MKRRNFLKFLTLSTAALLSGQLTNINCMKQQVRRITDMKNWIWLYSYEKFDTDESIFNYLSEIKSFGIHALLPQVYNSKVAHYQSSRLPKTEPMLERIIAQAKRVGLEVHAWIWTMPCNMEDIVQQHPEWYVVNRLDESAADKPAYVNHYKFLCPNQPGVRDFLRGNLEELAAIEGLDGVHFDYIRFPDVILAVNLQPKYGIVQDKEYPQYDYCYCDVCRDSFRRQAGIDPLTLKVPATHEAWVRFRYDSITSLVNDVLIPVVRSKQRHVFAAVFPNWQHVRQEWWKWNLDSVMPMLYHRYYDAGYDWIQSNIRYAVKTLPSSASIYSGLEVKAFDEHELGVAVQKSFEAGADGVSLFSARGMTDEHWRAFAATLKIR